MKIRPTHYRIQAKIFEKAGCIYVRTKGDHLIYHLFKSYFIGVKPVRFLFNWGGFNRGVLRGSTVNCYNLCCKTS